MSYKVLYRKYRPDSFNKIVGQKSIVDNLKKSVIDNTFAHAYIFTGPRGTGKTSTAKVLAKALTCQSSKDGEPCGECINCKNFATSPDIIEIDAASNNGVNEIRELRNNITLAPAESKYKIYIIDEVHMLSQGAFNALLKTLEEPPAHAIFILATTEVYKVPITILSRCQRCDFKKINKHDMNEHLKEICQSEKITYEEGVLDEIYELSEGCLRDALSILDQTSKDAKNVTKENLLKDYNMISASSVNELLTASVEGQIESIIETIESYENSGINAQKLLKRIINYLEKIAIDVKLKKNTKYKFETLSELITNLNRCYIDARINENVFTMIKLSFLEASSPTTNTPVQNKKEEKTPIKTPTTSVPEKQIEKPKDDTKEQSEQKKVEKPKNLSEIRINNCFVEPSKEALGTLSEYWSNLDAKKIKSVDVTDYKVVAASPKYAIFTAEEDSLANLFNMKSQEIEKAMKKDNHDIKIIAITTGDWLKEKEKYRNNVKSKVKYEYIEEPAIEEGTSKMKKEVENLFTEKVVEIS